MMELVKIKILVNCLSWTIADTCIQRKSRMSFKSVKIFFYLDLKTHKFIMPSIRIHKLNYPLLQNK